MIKKIISILLILIITFCSSLSFFAEEELFDVDAEQAIILNMETNAVLYDKNADSPTFCGFLPRLMVCILLVESGLDLETVISIPSGISRLTPQISSADLKSGEKISLNDLLAAILVGNSQEAAVSVAMFLSGDRLYNFIDTMNQRALDLGATSTYFANVTGYYSESSLSITTARDAAKIVSHALNLDYIIERANLSFVNLTVNNKARKLYTRNAVIDSGSIYYNRKASGVAVHGDNRIGSSMACMTEDKSVRFVSVAISSQSVSSVYADISKMLDFSIKEYTHQILIKQNTPVREISVKLGKGRDHVVLVAEQNIEASLPKSIDINNINKIIQAPDALTAPIKKGTVLGSVILEYEGTVYGSTNIIAQTNVELDIIAGYTEKISDFFSNKYVWAVIITFIMFVSLYILVAYIINRRKIKERNLKKRDRINFKN